MAGAVVGSFTSRPHAEMAAGMLRARGIDARVIGDDAGGVAPYVTLGHGGGYTLEVAAEDHEDAVALLEQRDEDAAPGGLPGHPRAMALRTILRVALGLFVALVVLSALGVL